MTVATPTNTFVDLQEEIEDLAGRLLPGVVSIRNGNGDGGSGVIWSSDLVITNDHVAYHDTCRVVLYDGRELEADVIARDPENDLAALRLNDTSIRLESPFVTESDTPLQAGQLVVALGHPMGTEWALTTGILSRLPQPGDRRSLLRASITLLPGNSGGPLVDASGRLLGINAMISGPAEAISVPVQHVKALVATLR